MISDGIDMSEYNIIPDINNSPEFSVFTDEFKPIIKDALKLPYGSLAIIVYGIQDILRGHEEDIPKYLRPTMMKAYYLLAGALLTKNDVMELKISKEDIDLMNDILKRMVGLLALMDKYYRREIEVDLKDGEWYIRNGDKLIEEAEKDVTEFFHHP